MLIVYVCDIVVISPQAPHGEPLPYMVCVTQNQALTMPYLAQGEHSTWALGHPG